MNIRGMRKKSVRTKLLIDLGAILIGICVINYVIVSYIYTKLLVKEDMAKSDIVTSAAIMQAKSIVHNTKIFTEKLIMLPSWIDDQISIEEKIKQMQAYTSNICEVAIIGTDGLGLATTGEQFSVKGSEDLEKLFTSQANTLLIREYKGEKYLVLVEPIKDEKGDTPLVLLSIRILDGFFEQVMRMSGGQACFIANTEGDIYITNRYKDGLEKSRLVDSSEKVKNFFERNLLHNKIYTKQIEAPQTGEWLKFHYGVISEDGWILGIVSDTDWVHTELISFKKAMLTGLIIMSSIGIILVYMSATSITKRIRYIADYLNGTIINEFRTPIPEELLENEDEISSIVREVKHLEEEVVGMLDTIKESVDYLNDRINRENS